MQGQPGTKPRTVGMWCGFMNSFLAQILWSLGCVSRLSLICIWAPDEHHLCSLLSAMMAYTIFQYRISLQNSRLHIFCHNRLCLLPLYLWYKCVELRMKIEVCDARICSNIATFGLIYQLYLLISLVSVLSFVIVTTTIISAKFWEYLNLHCQHQWTWVDYAICTSVQPTGSYNQIFCSAIIIAILLAIITTCSIQWSYFGSKVCLNYHLIELYTIRAQGDRRQVHLHHSITSNSCASKLQMQWMLSPVAKMYIYCLVVGKGSNKTMLISSSTNVY